MIKTFSLDMYIIAAIGLLTMCLSVIMVLKPDYWSEVIVVFSKKAYFHRFEVLSRFILGVIFLYFHNSSQNPFMLKVFGYLLIVVSISLIVIGEANHRKFALWSANTFRNIFRPAGFFSFTFGMYLIYISINH